jgi:hypothetical protein
LALTGVNAWVQFEIVSIWRHEATTGMGWRPARPPVSELGNMRPSGPNADVARLKEEVMKGGISNSGGLTRRKVLLAGTTATASIALLVGKAEAKIQQSAVKYQTEPKDGKQCSECNFFVAPNGCKQVDGEISPTGYCLLWVKKPS